jgi:putative ABC transport system permease protein
MSGNFKHALRSLRQHPGFALIAILILAMGIGSTLSVFNLLDALLLRPLPIRNAQRLVRISRVLREGDFGSLPSTVLDALNSVPDYRSACGFDTSHPGVEIHGSIVAVGALGFSGDCFSTLGIRTQLGRSLTPEDDQPGAEPAAVITDSFWRDQFHGRRDVLGQRIRMSAESYTIIGVAEPGFTGLLVGFPEGLIVPIHQENTDLLPNGQRPRYRWVNILALRAPGVSEQQAAARFEVRAPQLLQASVPPYFDAERRRVYLASKIAASSGKSGVDYFLRRRFGSSLYAASGICAAILLIGCTNLTNLLLARSLRRRREVAVRFALGAKWSQVAGLFVAESLLLTAAGAGLGLLLAQALDRWLIAQGARMFGNFDPLVSFDWRIALLFAAAAAAIVSALAGASAWQAGRLRSAGHLQEGARSIAGTSGAVQRALIVLQISLTLSLVAGGNLLTASLHHLDTLDLGVQTRNVWDVMLSTHPAAQIYFDRAAYDRQLLSDIHQVPGVETAAFADFIPFFTFPNTQPIASLDSARPERLLDSSVFAVSSELFATLGVRVLAGRDFEERADGEPGVIVSESLARQLSTDPETLIGHHVRLGTGERAQRLRVTAVVSNAQTNLAHPEQLAPFTAYLNRAQQPDRQAYPVLLIKTASNRLNVDALRRIIDPQGREYVDRVRTLAGEKDGALLENKLLAYLAQAFSALALAMAAAGLFGLLSYHVANRTSEIGIRMALGAQRAQIRWMILRQVIAIAAIGCCAGLLCSLGTARMIQGLLFGVSPYDARLLALACLVLSATALLAAFLPARRASSIDPLLALRHE